MLLPIIKIVMRNVMARTLLHLNDEIPEVVLMNVEVFNSLFMSYCMQNSPSIWTTLGLIAVDGAQMLASMHDVGVVIQRLQILKERVDEEHAQLALDNSMGTEIMGLRRKTILAYTVDILDRYQSLQKSTPDTTKPVVLAKAVSHEVKPKPKQVPKHILYSPRLVSRSKLMSSFNLSRKIFASAKANSAEGKVDVTQLEMKYTMKVRKLLYITEFMVLINYVEVIVPVIFSANLFVMYHLPNTIYYTQITSMTEQHLWNTIGNVMLYCLLQLASLVLLFVILWQKLHVSAVRQLSFVLEKQGEQVQTKLVFWVFYNVQASLQHFASDYTFKFAWLH
ncbi:hypothetical protein PR003_g19110 [Phytophthora rubi]|uniref:Uncharacterized protein n=1 Tax=Phytophthora rubi TaxID=129364 RepID=A0A6A4E227_9STRA|nr:hypothetical protein PR001_g18169 [Phytophthora rubi]KAE9314954.1 hypothetical protein PR003_g19110 [Phytophthora rubi]